MSDLDSPNSQVATKSNEDVIGWLHDLWPDDKFTLPKINPRVLSGTYTSACHLVDQGGKRFLVKEYNLALIEGIFSEIGAYSRFGSNPILPSPIITLPIASQSNLAPLAILLPYYADLPEALSVLEVLAISLNLATIFSQFALQGFIYFDLKVDSLRLDSNGNLRLIDFTDLITPTQLYGRSSSGLPVVDRRAPSIPPEGVIYQEACDEFERTGADFGRVIKAAGLLNPEKYQVFSLGRLAIELFGGTMRSLRSRVRRSAGEPEGCFTSDEHLQITQLLKIMLRSKSVRRPSLNDVRLQLWKLLGPRLASKDSPYADKASNARRLLRTITRNQDEPLSGDIFRHMDPFWRI